MQNVKSCSLCKKAHAKCDIYRPCNRCVQKELECDSLLPPIVINPTMPDLSDLIVYS